MYRITKIRHVDRQHGIDLANSGKRLEGLNYIREHTEVLGEFVSYMAAREFWTALGMHAGANYHATEQELYRLK